MAAFSLATAAPLVAVWHHKFPDVPAIDVQELVTALSSPPRFALPPASQGHTRHYMPLGNDNRTKVFDTFVAVDRDDFVLAVWPDVELAADQCDLLRQLVAAMTYFGRAESWVCGEVIDELPFEPDVVPLELGVEPSPGYELVRTLTLAEPQQYGAWLESRLTASRSSAKGRSKKQSTTTCHNRCSRRCMPTPRNCVRRAGTSRPAAAGSTMRVHSTRFRRFRDKRSFVAK